MHPFLLYLMAFLYIAAGVYHFVNPSIYLRIMPDWLPYHKALVFISGVCEILLGILLIPPVTRPAAAWLIIAMLVVFFFLIHIPMTWDFWQHQKRGFWLTIARLPIQFLLIYWAWQYTGNGN